MNGRGTGLIIGKFDPPHRGHDLLIDAALAHVDRLIVIAYHFAGQETPPGLRLSWLREIHPEVDFRLRHLDEPVLVFDAAVHGPRIRAFLGDERIDVLFTSEPYGEAFASILGAREHISIDRDRVAVPCTSTMIRNAPLDNLTWLAPVVRAYYAKRVTVVGAESTGKTSLCAFLAERYASNLVEEYGRTFTLLKARSAEGVRWSTDEFFHIAREQQRREDEAARSANRVLFCDTDALATRVWHERYMGSDIATIAGPSKASLYLLPFPDVPFVADEIRDSEHLRYWMYERFVTLFETLGYRYEILKGTFEERREQAVAAVDRELATPATTHAE